jgi:hypothetical protein
MGSNDVNECWSGWTSFIAQLQSLKTEWRCTSQRTNFRISNLLCGRWDLQHHLKHVYGTWVSVLNRWTCELGLTTWVGMKSSVVFHGVNMYLELGCRTNEHIILQSTCCLHYQCFAATIFIKFGGLYYSVLLHFVDLFQCMGVSCVMWLHYTWHRSI